MKKSSSMIIVFATMGANLVVAQRRPVDRFVEVNGLGIHYLDLGGS
jgi:hypothetical protein